MEVAMPRSAVPPLLWLVVTLLERHTYAYMPTYVMLEGDCPGPSILFVRNSVQVSLTSNPLRYIEMARRKCSLTFQAQHSDHRLLLHWDALRLSPNNKQDHRVFLKSGRNIATPGDDRPDFSGHDYRSHFNQITLYYIGFPHFDYLRVTVTEIRMSMTCKAQETFCPRGEESFCISRELLCNGEDNCGDANVSDENHTSCMKSPVPTTRPTESPIPVGLVGALAAQPIIITILIAAFCIIKRRRQKTKEAAEAASNLQRRAVTPSRLRTQNEYVTLPHNTSPTPQKEQPEQNLQQLLHLATSTGMHITQPPAAFLPHAAPVTQTQRSANVSAPSVIATPPRRLLPPTPEEEPESNYVNLHHEGGPLHMPLLFQVPDINSMPLFHTAGLRKATVAPNMRRSLPREQEVSISEPGYMEIDDMDVTSSSSHQRKGSHEVTSRSPKPTRQGVRDHCMLDLGQSSSFRQIKPSEDVARSLKPSSSDSGVQLLDSRSSYASQQRRDSSPADRSLKPLSQGGGEHPVLDPRLPSASRRRREEADNYLKPSW